MRTRVSIVRAPPSDSDRFDHHREASHVYNLGPVIKGRVGLVGQDSGVGRDIEIPTHEDLLLSLLWRLLRVELRRLSLRVQYVGGMERLDTVVSSAGGANVIIVRALYTTNMSA